MSRPIAAVVVVGAALVVSACSGNGSAEPSSTSPASSTAASTSTSTATSSTTTTLAPTTTTTSAEQALDAEKAKVEAAYRAVEAAYLSVLLNLDNYDPTAFRALVVPGPWLDAQIAAFTQLRNEGRRVRPNVPDLRSVTVEKIELVSAASMEATVTSCYSNNLVLYEPGANAGPEDDVIVNDALGAHRYQYRMVKGDGVWRVLEGRTLQDWPGTSECSPSS